MNEKNHEFSFYLKSIRKGRKMTLVELADKAGTSNSYLSQLENMKRNPPKPDLLKKLASALSNGDEDTSKELYDNLMEKAGYSINIPLPDENSRLHKDLVARLEADKRKIELDEILNYNPLSLSELEVLLNQENLDHEEILAIQLLLKGIVANWQD